MITNGKPILDACCGSRMFWFDKDNPFVEFMDMAQWVNKHQLFHITPFDEFEPRKDFKCIEYRHDTKRKTK